jgi:hypothetical protein
LLSRPMPPPSRLARPQGLEPLQLTRVGPHQDFVLRRQAGHADRRARTHRLGSMRKRSTMVASRHCDDASFSLGVSQLENGIRRLP